jgi:hypothetical protein
MNWLEVTTWSPLLDASRVTVTGTEVAPAVPAAAFVVATAGIALALARGWGRVVAAAGVALGGALAAASAASVLADPEGIGVAAARSAVGVGVTTEPALVTGGAWLAMVVGVLAVLLGGVAVLASRRWSPPSARHAKPTGGGAVGDDATGLWDALSRGEDPTDRSTVRGRAERPPIPPIR